MSIGIGFVRRLRRQITDHFDFMSGRIKFLIESIEKDFATFDQEQLPYTPSYTLYYLSNKKWGYVL
jgi:hypothetical protein